MGGAEITAPLHTSHPSIGGFSSLPAVQEADLNVDHLGRQLRLSAPEHTQLHRPVSPPVPPGVPLSTSFTAPGHDTYRGTAGSELRPLPILAVLHRIPGHERIAILRV